MNEEKRSWKFTSRTQDLSNFLFRAPDPDYIIPFIIFFSILSGLLIAPDLEGLTIGIMIIAIPALLSAWSSTRLVIAFGGNFYFRRSYMTSFVGVLILFFVLIFGILIRPFIDVHWRFLIIYGYSLLVAFRYLVIRSTCLNYIRYSFVVSSAQLFFALVFHAILSVNDLGYLEENNFISLRETVFGILTSLVLVASVMFFAEIVNSPLKKDVGISGTDLMGFYLSDMTDGTKRIESLFLPLQEEYNIPFSIMAIRKIPDVEGKVTTVDGKDGHPGKPFHALIISPSVHPGPVGTIGGGDLPTKLAKPLSDLADHILVPHGAATNDNNPATTPECDKVVSAVRQLASSLQDDDFSEQASPFITSSVDVTVHFIRFGDKGFIIGEPVPFCWDDMSMAMFRELKWAAKDKGVTDILLVDAHNNSYRSGKSLHLGGKKSIEMEEQLVELIGRDTASGSCSIGIGAARSEKELNGLGPKGVETILFNTGEGEVGILLFDGNNMLPETRKELEKEARKFVHRVVIITADNHVVNATIGGYNPLGLKCDIEELRPLVGESIRNARQDLGLSSVAIRSGLIRGINVLGFGNTNRLVATINSTVSVVKRAAIVCMLLAMMASALVYYIV